MIMTMRPWYRGVVAACAAAGLLVTAACGGDDAGDDGAVDWWTINQEDSELGIVWQEFVGEFNEANPDGAQVGITPYENDPFKTAIAAAIQSEDPPDMFQTWGGGVLRTQVESGQVMDLTDELADVIATISPGALAPYVIDDRVYGIPYNTGMVGFWYNTELFDQAGITETPQTWTELLDVVQQLKDEGITPLALGGSDLWPGHFYWSYLAMRVAGLDAFVAASQNQAFEGEGFVQAGELLQELVALEPFQEGFLAVGYEQGDGQAATMGNGEAAMTLMGQWEPGAELDWAGIEPDSEEGEAVVANRAWFPFPMVEGGAGAITEIFGGGDGIALGANAPDEALEFLRLVYDRANFAAVTGTSGNVPVLADAEDMLNNQALLPLMDALAVGTGFQLYLDQDYPAAVGTSVNESVGALIAGEMAPDEVVTTVNEVWAREG
jgi:raffinose/stachyose/melibiose transport system substrate-binding protein